MRFGEESDFWVNNVRRFIRVEVLPPTPHPTLIGGRRIVLRSSVTHFHSVYPRYRRTSTPKSYFLSVIMSVNPETVSLKS